MEIGESINIGDLVIVCDWSYSMCAETFSEDPPQIIYGYLFEEKYSAVFKVIEFGNYPGRGSKIFKAVGLDIGKTNNDTIVQDVITKRKLFIQRRFLYTPLTLKRY